MKSYLLLILSAFLLIGCIGEGVEVGAGEVGKVVGPSGFDDEIINTSSFRLPTCNISACSRVVKLEVTKSTQHVKIEQVFLTKSKVDLTNVDAGVQFQVRHDDKSINRVFKEVRPNEHNVITMENIWNTYMQRKAPAAIVTVLRDNTIEDVLTKIPEIETGTFKHLQEEANDLPIEITDIGFGGGIGDIPEKVISSYRNLYAVEAEKQRRIRQLEADLVVETQGLAVQQVRANNDKISAAILGMPTNAYVELKIQEKFADAVADAADNNQPFALGSFQPR